MSCYLLQCVFEILSRSPAYIKITLDLNDLPILPVFGDNLFEGGSMDLIER